MAGGAGGTGGGVSSTSLLWAIIMSAFAGFGGILFGYDTGTIGGVIAMDDWLHLFGKFDPTLNWYIPTNDKSLVVSILSAGTFFGALLASPVGDTLGRKWGLVASCMVFCLGVGLQLDTSWAVFIVGRVIAGFGVGLVSCLVPMYQSECAPKSIRGLIVGLYQLAITIGALLAAVVLNATKDRPNHSSWRIPIAVQFAWAAILAGGMILLPESPRYLLLKNRQADARVALGRLMTASPDSPEVEAEAIEISTALAVEKEASQGGYLACFRNNEDRNGLRTWTGIMMQGWQQLTGINFIFYYGTTFFQQAGIKNAFVIQIVCDVVNTVMTLFGIQLIDRVGRRRLLLIGAAGMCFCEFIVAIVGVTAGRVNGETAEVNIAAQRVLIAFTCFYIAFFATSWGPVIWVLTGELFPLGVRAKSMSLAVASNWLWNFGIGYATPYLVNASTFGVNGVRAANLGVKVFFIWGGTCVGCFVFTYFFIPETRGLSLEQIDILYRESTILGSNAKRHEILSQNKTFSNTYHNEKETVDHDSEKAVA
ncbi:Major facilitator-type transporter ecdD [Psilocybe cubensis]|uniref:Major facilitator-type transporter ecdD n=2 Tax=Psilocybe cubensis TaxID=181762 RepID=A0ACB8H294_PSICU|nr:Major facilitator-type transporter ecdD [Psilocybe cubensis]KAH9482118.1 Major facilitator-type transporter ecdD [Psilocybe cubensis]